MNTVKTFVERVKTSYGSFKAVKIINNVHSFIVGVNQDKSFDHSHGKVNFTHTPKPWINGKKVTAVYNVGLDAANSKPQYIIHSDDSFTQKEIDSFVEDPKMTAYLAEQGREEEIRRRFAGERVRKYHDDLKKDPNLRSPWDHNDPFQE